MSIYFSLKFMFSQGLLLIDNFLPAFYILLFLDGIRSLLGLLIQLDTFVVYAFFLLRVQLLGVSSLRTKAYCRQDRRTHGALCKLEKQIDQATAKQTPLN